MKSLILTFSWDLSYGGELSFEQLEETKQNDKM